MALFSRLDSEVWRARWDQVTRAGALPLEQPAVGDQLHGVAGAGEQDEGGAQPDGVRLVLRLTHEELGRLAGTARETVSRTLPDLQDRRVIRFVGRQLEVIDLDQLQALARIDTGASSAVR
jgi:CRP-like cAMP-binding protein